MAGSNNFGLVGDWRQPTFPDIKVLEGELCLGDRLEFSRDAGYAHWGIYVGHYQGMRHAVIHFGMFEGGSKFCKKKTFGRAYAAEQKPEIRADTVGLILGGSGKVRINNSRDKEEQPLAPEDVTDTAKKMHQDERHIDYNLFNSNCEHFVNLCRYSRPHSDQISAAFQTVGTLGLVAAGVAFVVIAIGAITQRR